VSNPRPNNSSAPSTRIRRWPRRSAKRRTRCMAPQYTHDTAMDVLMPQMGESVAEGTIVRWIKKVGDKVDRDEPLFEISTDKVDAEIPSPAAGVVAEIRAKEGETVPVNSVVAVINQDGEGKPAAPAAAPAKEPMAEAKALQPPKPSPQADGQGTASAVQAAP